MSELTVNKLLANIQATLKAPKNQYNSFGKYKYRSCEDILEGVKPLLCGGHLTIEDEVLHVGDRYYIKATATLTYKDCSIERSALAREPDQKKGMDSSQVTGATSSYARKYALNGLFAIDDTKDADTQKPLTNNDFNKKKQMVQQIKDLVGAFWTKLDQAQRAEMLGKILIVKKIDDLIKNSEKELKDKFGKLNEFLEGIRNG